MPPLFLDHSEEDSHPSCCSDLGSSFGLGISANVHSNSEWNPQLKLNHLTKIKLKLIKNN